MNLILIGLAVSWAATRISAGIYAAALYASSASLVRGMPLRYHPGTLQGNVNFEDEIGAVCERLDGGGLLVWFHRPGVRYFANLDELKSRCGMRVLQRLADATVYRRS